MHMQFLIASHSLKVQKNLNKRFLKTIFDLKTNKVESYLCTFKDMDGSNIYVNFSVVVI